MECPWCGRALSASAKQSEDIRRAYEILERWQSTDLFERISTTTPLTTLKQQNRAPLLNIPLGPRPVLKSPAATERFLSGPSAEHAVNATAARGGAMAVLAGRSIEAASPKLIAQLPSLPDARLNPVPQATEQVLWDLLVAPEPLLATAAPAIGEEDCPSEPVETSAASLNDAVTVVPPLYVPVKKDVKSGIEATTSNSASLTGKELPEGAHLESVATDTAKSRLPNHVSLASQEMLDEVMSDATLPQFLNTVSEIELNHFADDRINNTAESDSAPNRSKVGDDDSVRSERQQAATTRPTAQTRRAEQNSLQTSAGDKTHAVGPGVSSVPVPSHSDADSTTNPLANPFSINTQRSGATGDIPAENRPFAEAPAAITLDQQRVVPANQVEPQAILDRRKFSESQVMSDILIKPTDDEKGAGVNANAVDAAGTEKRGRISASTVAVSGPEAYSTGPAEFFQSAAPMLMSSASIHEESANEQVKSAESANEGKQSPSEGTKKSQRTPMRRPPLHRRFQNLRPVSESSAGSDTVTRKLRLDQTGGNADAAQAKEPVTALPSSVAPETKIVSNSPKAGRRFRIDNAESIDEITGTDGRRSRTHGLPRHRYIDEAHETQLRGPHFEVTAPRRSNLTSMTGQFLAYLGVLGLTVGTAMVIYGHFGGYSEYTPTGWLVTTVAQMLLFLGVINLVSGGIEQNNEDVSRRINTLGEQLLRIEQVTSEAMRGPKLPARLYADPDAVAQEASRETASIDRQ